MSSSRLEKQLSMAKTESKTILLDERIALQCYMQELLNEVAWVEPIDQAPEICTVTKEIRELEIKPVIEKPIVLPSAVKVQTLAELEAECNEDIVACSQHLLINEQVQIARSGSAAVKSEKLTATIPEWAGSHFRALYANYGKLKLIMPLVNVQTVLKVKELVRVESTTAVIGFVQRGTKRIPVLDVNILPASGNHDNDDINTEEGFIAVAENLSVGMYFQEIDDTHEIKSESITWRCNDESASWIAGVDPENLSIIVDFDCLRNLL